jgi:hypothetical protein
MLRDSIEQRRRRLRRRKRTHNKRDFEEMRRWFSARLNIVAEGDSWFTHPSRWIISKPPNLGSHIPGWAKGIVRIPDCMEKVLWSDLMIIR